MKTQQNLDLSEVATFEETKSFLAKKIEDLKKGVAIFYCIFDNGTKKLIGGIEIREPGFVDGQLGAWINENYWGGGRYQEALDLILKEYFRVKNVDSINAYIDVTNARSLKAHKKYGFRVVREFAKNGKIFYELVILPRISRGF